MLDFGKMPFSTQTVNSPDTNVKDSLNNLQALFDNSENALAKLQEKRCVIRNEIKAACELQRLALQRRESVLLQRLDEVITRRAKSLDIYQQEVDQVMVDLDGYAALLLTESVNGISKDKLDDWVATTLSQADEICGRSNVVGGECPVSFSYSDMTENIAQFGSLSQMQDYISENIANEDADDDSIAIVTDGQWLHSNSVINRRPAVELEMEKGTTMLSQDQSNELGHRTGNDAWLSSAVPLFPIQASDKKGDESWIISSSCDGSLASSPVNKMDLHSQWLIATQSGGTMQSVSVEYERSISTDGVSWLCSEAGSKLEAGNSSAIANQFESISLMEEDSSRWLQKKKGNDDDICKWLAGRTSSQCDDCSKSCPFEEAKAKRNISSKQKWLATATNW